MSIKFSDLPNPRLSRLVSAQVGGKDELLSIAKNVVNYGADSGFSGFIYYSETVKFWRTHKKQSLKA